MRGPRFVAAEGVGARGPDEAVPSLGGNLRHFDLCQW